MNERPRCPFRVASFDTHDMCDPDCAWLVEMKDTGGNCTVCAVAAIAMNNYLFEPLHKMTETPSN